MLEGGGRRGISMEMVSTMRESECKFMNNSKDGLLCALGLAFGSFIWGFIWIWVTDMTRTTECNDTKTGDKPMGKTMIVHNTPAKSPRLKNGHRNKVLAINLLRSPLCTIAPVYSC